jgi:DNA-binding response OmpR family regulator
MKHVVLVEDDEPIRFIFEIALKAKEYRVINLESCEKIINNEIDVPDLFILDKQISGINGLDVCRFIKKSDKYRNVPVVIISAITNIVSLAKEAGADDAIVKPFSLRELRETVAKYTAGSYVEADR